MSTLVNVSHPPIIIELATGDLVGFRQDIRGRICDQLTRWFTVRNITEYESHDKTRLLCKRSDGAMAEWELYWDDLYEAFAMGPLAFWTKIDCEIASLMVQVKS